MDLSPLTAASASVQLHACAAIAALAVGTVQAFGVRMGRAAHRVLGWSWVALMALAAGSAVFIRDLNPGSFSLIHIFVPITIIGVASGLMAIRRGDVARHRAAMRGVFAGGLVIAGALAFLPGRVMHEVVFG